MTQSSPRTTGVEPRFVFVETLGCKVNAFESEYIAHQLQSVDSSRFENDDQSLYIVNTCTVTGEADRQSRQAIRRAVRNHPEAKVVVTGCYAEMEPGKCAEIPGVDLVVPGSMKLRIPQLIAGETELTSLDSPVNSNVALPSEVIAGFESRTRAFLQVQQGCDNGCTFCIIHKARGPSRSIAPTTVTRQVEQYVRQGFREVVICGIDLGSFGEDLSNGMERQYDLASLVIEFAVRYPQCRFRLSSIDPSHITPRLIDAMRKFDNVCPHIHLSLQSASPLILKRMKRRYCPEDVYRVVTELRSACPDLVLSADIMAGFPTESDADFDLTLNAVHDLEIAYPHVFSYSQRDGTPAALIPRQIPSDRRKSRARILRQAGDDVRHRVLERYVGKRVDVLVEGASLETESMKRSRMANYLPVYVHSGPLEDGDTAFVDVTGFYGDGLLGEIV